MSEKTEIVRTQPAAVVRAEPRRQEPAQMETFARLVLGDERVDGIAKHHKSLNLHIGAGVKGPSGSPEQKDRFHILNYIPDPAVATSRDGAKRNILKRSYHPDFVVQGGEKITEIAGRLIFTDINDSLALRLVCPKAVGTVAPPSGAPYCSNDGAGDTATRWVADEWKRVRCDFNTCQYSRKKECKPQVNLTFEVTNPKDGRAMSARFMSQGFGTLTRFLAFQMDLQKRMRQVGLDVYNGLPIRLRLTTRSKGDGTGGQKWPVVDVSTDGDIFEGVHHTLGKIRAAVTAGLDVRNLLTARDASQYPELDAYDLGGPGLPPPVSTREIPAVLAQETANASRPTNVIEGVVEPEPPPQSDGLKIPLGVRQGPDGLVVCNDCDGLMNPASRAGYWVCPDSTCLAGVRPDGTWTKVPK